MGRLKKVWEVFETLNDSEELVAKNLELRALVEEVYFPVKLGLATNLPTVRAVVDTTRPCR